jgi:hypothetical protein
MTMDNQKSKDRTETEKSPVVWLTVYEAAVRRGDVALANRARRELVKRGVVVQPAGVSP